MPTNEEKVNALKVEIFDIIQQQELYNLRIQQLQEIKVKKLQEMNELQKEEKK